jgi:tetratricopeptide (TPR) repeat protein
VTDDRLRAAEAQLAALAQGDDELAAQAAYLQARIWQAHLSQPDFAKAAELFLALAARQPQSRWAQLGLVKLALLHLYALPGPGGPVARHEAAEALLAQISEPALQRDVHLQLGLAGVFYRRPLAEVLEHLLATDRIGGVAGQAAEDLVAQIGELSMRDGQNAQARRYYERYLREYPLSGRCFTVRARLRDLDARESAAPGGRP